MAGANPSGPVWTNDSQDRVSAQKRDFGNGSPGFLRDSRSARFP